MEIHCTLTCLSGRCDFVESGLVFLVPNTFVSAPGWEMSGPCIDRIQSHHEATEINEHGHDEYEVRTAHGIFTAYINSYYAFLYERHGQRL